MIMRSLIVAALFGLLVGIASNSTGAVAQTAPSLYFAVVNSDGSMARNSGRVKSQRLGTGLYTVTFPANVSKCAYAGTVGSSTTVPGQGGSTNMNPLGGNSRGVQVKTGAQGTAEDRGFYLIVVCE